MFDSTNPSIILCSHELEEVLNMKALHVTEIRSAARSPYNNYIFVFRDIVMEELEKVADVPLAPQLPSLPPRRPSSKCCVQRECINIFRHSDIHAGWINKNGEFRLKPKFLEVVRSLPDTNQDQTIFSYEEVRGNV